MKFKKISFKKNIMRFNITIIVILSVFMCTYYFLNQYTSKQYNEMTQRYDDISEFYKSLSHANFSFKSYLYTENEDEIAVYEEYIGEAQTKLSNMKEHIPDDLKMRIELLENMLSNYQVAAQNTQDIVGSEGVEYQRVYDEFLLQYELIEKTSTTYYEYITTYIVEERVDIHYYEGIIFFMMFLIIIVGIVWILFFSIITVRSLTKPLYSILNNIKLIKKGDYDLSLVSNTSKEMEELCDTLDDMAKSVKKNILNEKEKANLQKQLLEQENENLKKDELLALSELKMLQDQINPHFLFNTLNMIYKSARVEKAYDTSEMIDKTSQLLRYALDKANHTSDLYSEIQSLRNYIFIQEKRFNKRIQFILDVGEKVPNIQTPGFLMQPLVENAVKHGVGNMIEDGEIVISVQQDRKDLIISVSDNGAGMETEVLERMILNEFKTDGGSKRMGLYNVTQRIHMFYGKAAEVSFNSYPECGFEVIIHIKKEGFYV